MFSVFYSLFSVQCSLFLLLCSSFSALCSVPYFLYQQGCCYRIIYIFIYLHFMSRWGICIFVARDSWEHILNRKVAPEGSKECSRRCHVFACREGRRNYTTSQSAQITNLLLHWNRTLYNLNVFFFNIFNKCIYKLCWHYVYTPCNICSKYYVPILL